MVVRSRDREKFATRVDAEILSAVRSLAQQEGRQLQALVDEALANLLEKRKGRPRAQVMGRLSGEPRALCDALQEAGGLTDYLTVIEVLAIHADQIDRYGGAPGARDMRLLEAALFRPDAP
jgi:predicted ArsR family transcriptional regulator